MNTVTIGDLTLYGGTSSPNGFRFEKLTGWYDLPESKAGFESRPGSHGSFNPGYDWRESAKFSVEGSFEGGSRTEIQAAKRKLTRQGLSVGLEVSVTDEDGPTTREASLRFVDIDDDRGRDYFRFSMDFLAADPFRYGTWVPAVTGVPTASSGLSWPRGTSQIGDPEGDGLVSTDGYTADPSNPGFYMTTGLQQDANGLYVPLTTGSTPYWDWGTEGVSGRVSASNTGTADTFSTFEVTGGLSGGFMLTWVPTGAEIRFVRPILDGSTVFLNPRTGRASIDGQSDVSGFLTKSEWWPVLPGQVGQVQFTPLGVTSGTPMLTVRTADAFV